MSGADVLGVMRKAQQKATNPLNRAAMSEAAEAVAELIAVREGLVSLAAQWEAQINACDGECCKVCIATAIHLAEVNSLLGGAQ